MRVLMVSKCPAWRESAGGEAIYMHELAQALAEIGVNVTMLMPAVPGDRRTIERYATEYVRPVGRKLLPLALYMKVRDRLDDFDLVHLQGGEGACFVIGKRLMGGPPVLAVQQFNPRKRRWYKESIWRKYERWVSSKADILCTPSEYTRRTTAEIFGVSSRMIRTVPGGVGEEFIALGERRTYDSAGGLRLLSVGKLGEGKGTETLIRAVAAMANPERIELIIVGDGPVSRYSELSNELNVSGLIEFSGYAGHDELLRNYERADIFVLPTRKESFGLAIADAMAAGLPTVVSNTTAIPELVDDGKTGVLVPADAPNELAAVLDKLVEDSGLRRELGEAACRAIRSRYTWAASAERMLEVYEELLANAVK
ncbi:glycosyltransferase family 4 protein [Candidatus Hydrogenedentota bacterium]